MKIPNANVLTVWEEQKKKNEWKQQRHITIPTIYDNRQSNNKNPFELTHRIFSWSSVGEKKGGEKTANSLNKKTFY